MDRLDAQSIAEIVRSCVGHTDTTGDELYDTQSHENANKYLKVMGILLEDIHTLTHDVNSENVNQMLISCRAIGFLAESRTDIDKWLKQSRDKLLNGD